MTDRTSFAICLMTIVLLFSTGCPDGDPNENDVGPTDTAADTTADVTPDAESDTAPDTGTIPDTDDTGMEDTGNDVADDGGDGDTSIGDGGDTSQDAPADEQCDNGTDDDGDGAADCADDDCWSADVCDTCAGTGEESADLDVLFVSRTPRYPRFTVQYSAQGVPVSSTGGEWPDPGTEMTFTAVVKNNGGGESANFRYTWNLDGNTDASGVAGCLEPGERTELTWKWNWKDEDHDVRFALEPLGRDGQTAEEASTKNDARLVHTKALSYRFHIEPSVYEEFNGLENMVGTTSFEDWAQAHIDELNAMLNDQPPAGDPAEVYVFLDEVVVEQNLPPRPEHAPTDRNWDGRWGWDDAEWTDQKIRDEVGNLQGTLLHELSHQLGIIDTYALNYDRNYVAQNEVNGESWYISEMCIAMQGCPHLGLMSDTSKLQYSPHTLRGLASTRGHRRGFFGDYLLDVPHDNHVKLVDESGDAITGADVNFYQKGINASNGRPEIDSTPEITETTDGSGELTLPNRDVTREVTTATGHSLRPNPFGDIMNAGQNSLFLVEVERPGADNLYGWLSLYEFNLAYWEWRDANPNAAHEDSSATYEVTVE